jgi:DNA-binding MarR family transcriptional regulator
LRIKTVARQKSDSTVTFIAMSRRWREVLPSSLRRESPVLLLRLLAIVEMNKGIPQARLREQLEVNQSYLSKLISKLIAHGYLLEEFDECNKRIQPLMSTDAGESLLRLLEPQLTATTLRELAEQQIELSPRTH